MKILILFILSTLHLTVKAQNFEVRLTGDTLTIISPSLTSDPFGFGEDPLRLLRSHSNAKIKYETLRNRHVDNQIDTSFYITIGPDFFEVYKAASENFLSEARIRSSNFRTKHGLEVGQTKIEFRKIMDEYDLDAIPDNVRLKNKIVLEWIDLKFEHDKIKQISFKGYVD